MHAIEIEVSNALNPLWWVVWLDQKLRLAFSLAVTVANSSPTPFAIRNMFLETTSGMDFPDIRAVEIGQKTIQYLGGVVHPIIAKPYEKLTAVAFATDTAGVIFQIDRVTFEQPPTAIVKGTHTCPACEKPVSEGDCFPLMGGGWAHASCIW